MMMMMMMMMMVLLMVVVVVVVVAQLAERVSGRGNRSTRRSLSQYRSVYYRSRITRGWIETGAPRLEAED
jgi:uncharacterized membrane protein